MNNLSIVLVEDNPDDVELMMRAFRAEDIKCDIRVANDGMAALDLLLGPHDTTSPAVVLLDLKLPGLDGFHVLRRLRGDPRTWNLPIVILTSSLEPGDLSKAYRLGANSYVRKPTAFRELLLATQQIAAYWLVLNQRAPSMREVKEPR